MDIYIYIQPVKFMDIWWRSYTGWMTVGVFDDFDSDMSLQIGPNSWASFMLTQLHQVK